MAKIDSDSIKEKIKQYVKDNSYKKALDDDPDKDTAKILNKIKEKFLECYRISVSGNGFNEGATNAIGDLSFSEPKLDEDFRYVIYADVDKNSRTSLVPDKYDGVEDMAALLNNGYATHILFDFGIHDTPTHAQVYGLWHGRGTWSLPVREGKHFVQDCIDSFNNLYGDEFGVTATLTEDGERRFE